MDSKKWNGYVDDLVFGILSFNDISNLYELGRVVYYCDHQSSLPRIKKEIESNLSLSSTHPPSQPTFLSRSPP